MTKQIPYDLIPASDLPRSTPGAFDSVVGVDESTGAARRFPMPSAGTPRAYEARADLPASATEGTAAYVNNDPNPDNNGLWAYLGGEWVKSADRVTELAAQVAANTAGLVLSDYRMTTRFGSGDPRDTFSNVVVGVRDQNGRAAGIAADMRFHGVGVELYSAHLDRDSASALTPIITAVNGGAERVVLGMDSAGLPVVPGIGGGGSTAPEWRDPAYLRGDWGQFNVRQAESFVYATVQTRGGIVADVKQKRTPTTFDTAVAIHADGIEAVLVMGQSNAGAGSGEGAPAMIDPGWPHHALKFEGQASMYGASPVTSMPGKTDLVPMLEQTNAGQSPHAMMVTAANDLDARAWRVTPRAALTSWEGSQPITSFFPGTPGHYLYENAIEGLRALERVSRPYGGITLNAILWIQGENMTSGYQGYLEDYIDTVLPLFSAEIGQAETPHFLMRQTALGTSQSAWPSLDSALPQLAVARARLGLGVTMTGPNYQLPLHDNIHANNLGRMMGGEQDAIAWRAVKGGVDWHPLWPVAGGVVREGTEVIVPFQIPPEGRGLVIDSDWVLSVPNAGFVYADDAGTSIEITNVEVSGTSVVITLSGDPGDAVGQRIEYALYTGPGDAGWASSRGLLYAETGIRSPFAERGHPIPDTIRLYCVRFREFIN